MNTLVNSGFATLARHVIDGDCSEVGLQPPQGNLVRSRNRTLVAMQKTGKLGSLRSFGASGRAAATPKTLQRLHCGLCCRSPQVSQCQF